jgi:hypothetical protein
MGGYALTQEDDKVVRSHMEPIPMFNPNRYSPDVFMLVVVRESGKIESYVVTDNGLIIPKDSKK